MNDNQLMLLVRAWANRLSREVDILRDALPDTLPKRMIRAYVGPTGLFGPIKADSDNPDNWREQSDDYIVLDGLNDLLAELNQAVENLTPEGGD